MTTLWVYPFKVTATCMDSEGEVTTTEAWFPVTGPTIAGAQAIAGTYLTALAKLTNCVVTRAQLTFEAIQGGFTLPARDPSEKYLSAEDKLFLEFRSNHSGTIYQCMIPAPKSACFLGDEETADPAATDLGDFVTLIGDDGSTRRGDTSLILQKGYRLRKKTRRHVRQGIPTELGG